ncbi:hypothetical protein [Halorubrum vacuolatum]|uniref:Uncharacterized protein n=1 Tax=Halorubrum vacuolatum TaxID=63740 RepID=A0A238W933_HALVU|nr:hypothetical protein [Halorubrum vacuolatum]SNR43018.1 hypothetical protein SAMN06264855_10654 [Halorubrum vacuolatum]
MPRPAAVITSSNNLVRIGAYDGYILELRPEPDLRDEVTLALDDNFERVGEYLDDEIYIRFSSLRMSDLPERVEEKWSGNHPALVVFEDHPGYLAKAEEKVDKNTRKNIFYRKLSESDCILFELNGISNSTEVTKILQIVCNHVQEEEFMNDLSWEKRKICLRRAVEQADGIGGFTISVLSLRS